MMTNEELRKKILIALFSDHQLYEQLVLKGGNALYLIFQVGDRTSLDLDFSIADDFEDLSETATRIENRLTEALATDDLILFDFSMHPKPRTTIDDWWGGYSAEFKLIEKSHAEQLEYDTSRMRRESLPIGARSQRRKYIIEISKYEYIDDRIERDLQGVTIRVYSPVLLAAEKLRALLQQHPDYPQISKPTKRSRARDLYDIWILCDHFALRLEAHLQTVEAVFHAKKVDLALLSRLRELRNLHFASWSDVENAVGHTIEDFDFYFNYVVGIAERLYAQWNVDTP